MKLLGFDSCIVATRDARPVIHSFGQRHMTTILDSLFLSKLPDKLGDRIPEEALLRELANHSGYRRYGNKDWRHIYEASKSRLLSEQDFSGFNATLSDVVYFIEVCITDDQKREIATRMLYVTLSHLLIIMDFILKDIAFLDQKRREQRLSNGLTFGNLGKEGVSKIIEIATQISGNRSPDSYLNSLRTIPIEMLIDFFSRTENINSLFSWARDFENAAYNGSFVNPNDLEGSLKGPLSLILDYAEIDRRKFFGRFSVPNARDNGLRIISATYGTHRNSFDITNALNLLIKDNRLELIVGNDIAGDPDQGTAKDCKIVYELNGQKQTKSFKEGERVLIPEHGEYV